jgi:prepilin-type N-terminal cleavage/methylation domain-containing protein
MSIRRFSAPPASGESGFTLVELLVGMSITLVVSLVAFSFLEFSSRDVSRTTDRVHVDQAGRTALERLMTNLHSGCVASQATPVRVGSSNTVLRYVSEHGEAASLPSVTLHEVIYTPASGSTEGTLTERSWTSTAASVAPNYLFNEAATPKTTRLLNGIRQSQNEKKESVPMFQYYRYYTEADKPEASRYGELNPTPLGSTKLTEEQAEAIAKVTISFTLAPEGKEASTFGGGRPVAFEDSAIMRLAPSSTEPSVINLPCAS